MTQRGLHEHSDSRDDVDELWLLFGISDHIATILIWDERNGEQTARNRLCKYEWP